MEEILNTLLVSCVPAIITGIISYLTANKKAKAEIATLQESNKHEIEKLMKQHEVDIESLKENLLMNDIKCIAYGYNQMHHQNVCFLTFPKDSGHDIR